MAILAGGLLVLPDAPVEPPTPPSIAYREDVGTITASWIDPDGTEWPLSTIDDDTGWFTMKGPASWGSTPIEIVTDALSRGGEQVRFIRSKPRRIQWPLYVFGDDHMQFVDRNRRIMRAFTMTTQRGIHGYLKVQRPDGRYRIIAAYYEEGFEGESDGGHLWSKYVITLYCPDGYWSGDRPVQAERSFTVETDPGTGVPKNFYTPFMYLTSSQVVYDEGGGQVGNTQILNDGDVESWPEWTITGPMTKATCQNLTLGLRFAVTHTLVAGQTLTIATNRPHVRGPGDANLSGKIDWFNPAGGAHLWPLADGLNDIRFVVDGAALGTKINMQFTPRYESV